MKIPEVRYIKFRSNRNFGVELEMNNKVHAKDLVRVVSATDPDRPVIQSNHYEQDYDNEYWHIKFDRSCGDIENQGGWEVASYKASGYKDIEKMGKVTDALNKAGVAVNKDCGFHIHAEIADFGMNSAANLVAYWMKIEPIICEMLPKHRVNNKYCSLLTKKFENEISKVYTARTFWELVKPRRFDHPNRRVSLNMCNYAQMIPNRRTVELRLPDCVLDGKEVKNWIRLFVSFVDFVKNKDFPGTAQEVSLYETMKIVGLHNENPFFILSKGLRDTKIWFMKRILKYSDKAKIRTDAEMFLNALEVTPSQKKVEVIPVPVEEKPKQKKQRPDSDTEQWMWWKPSYSSSKKTRSLNWDNETEEW